MAASRRDLDWDAIATNSAVTLNAMGGNNGTAYKPIDFHPFRKHEPEECDITVLKKLLPNGG